MVEVEARVEDELALRMVDVDPVDREAHRRAHVDVPEDVGAVDDQRPEIQQVDLHL